MSLSQLGMNLGVSSRSVKSREPSLGEHRLGVVSRGSWDGGGGGSGSSGGGFGRFGSLEGKKGEEEESLGQLGGGKEEEEEMVETKGEEGDVRCSSSLEQLPWYRIARGRQPPRRS